MADFDQDAFELELRAAGLDDEAVVDAYPLAPMQAGLVALTLRELDSEHSGDMPYLSRLLFRIKMRDGDGGSGGGSLDSARLERAWRCLVAKHEILRTAFVQSSSHADGIVQVVLDPAIALENITWQTQETSADPVQDAHIYMSQRSSHIAQKAAANPQAEGNRRGEGRREWFTTPALWLSAGLFRSSPASPDAVFALVIHHALYDGWSMNLLLRDLEQLYCFNNDINDDDEGEDPRNHNDNGWRAETTPFADFVGHCLDPELLSSASSYWSRALAELEPAAWPRPLDCQNTGSNGAQATAKASQTVSRRFADPGIARAAAKFGVTPASVFKAALACVLARRSGSNDVVLGYTSSGRAAPLAQIEAIVGPCIATLPLRLSLSHTSVEQLIRDADSRSLEALQYEHVGLNAIQAAARLGPGSPLFNVLLAFQNFDANGNGDGDGNAGGHRVGWQLEPLDAEMSVTYPVSIEVQLDAGGYVIHFSYDPAYLARAHAESFVGQTYQALQQLAHRLEHSPTDQVSLIDIRTENDTRAQLGLSGPMHKSSSENPSLSPPLLLPLHRHVERIARAWPHKAAIQTYDGVFWSYSQLHRISVGLGARIARQLALAPGSLVPVALEKRASSVALILALFWLRCAYVPCDPSQPQARLHRILDQLNSHLLLANGTIDSSVSRKVEVINVEAWVRELEGQGSLECVSLSSDDGVPFVELPCLDRTAELDGLAYQLFTSGSTGTPKGVKVSHRSVAASIAAQQALYGTRQQQECGNAFGAPLWTHRCLQFSQFSFDWSVWDLTMLASGACLCLRDLTDMLPEMGDTLSCLRVTLLQTTPTVAKLFTPSEARHLDLLCLSGEPLVDDVRNVWAPHVRLINAYGITEITVVCCAQDRFTVDMPASLIGNALGTSRLLVLDDNNEPCALDCPGELLVCGDQIAEGYFRDPERTAAAFVRLRDGAKAYRSGDLVVFDSALNALRYLRRKDCQVNIKGLRIELGEVQVGLTRSASAQMPICAVDVEAMGNELVAFVVFEPSFSRSEEPNKIKKTGPATTQEIEIDTSSSRQALQELAVQARTELPRYMVPTVWIALAELPLVSSGKLDKRKLDQVYQRHLETWCTAQTQRKSTPDDDNHKNKEGPRSAKGPMMTSVLEAWSHVLGRDRKSISSNVEFGFLGGDSILAIRLSSHLRRLGIGLSVSDIAAHATIEAQCELLSSRQSGTGIGADLAVEARAMPPTQLEMPMSWSQVARSFAESQRGELQSSNDINAPNTAADSLVQACYPATSTQQRMLLASMVGAADSYHVQQLYRIAPHTDRARLRTALEQLVERNDILRTVFAFGRDEDGGARLFQVVLANVKLQWEERELPGTADAYSPALLYALNGAPSQRWTTSEPLCNFRLLSFADGGGDMLLWTIHHALDDAWTVRMQLAELSKLYSSAAWTSTSTSELCAMPPFRPAEFGDFVRMVEDRRSEALEFWTRELGGVRPSKLQQHVRVWGSGYAARRSCCKAELERVITFDVQSMARLETQGIHLSSTVVSSFALALSDVVDVNNNELTIGQLLAGRSGQLLGLEGVVGPCISLVPRKLLLPAEGQDMIEWIRTVQAAQANITQHEHLSYEDLARAGIVPRQHTDLFDAIINFRNYLHSDDDEDDDNGHGQDYDDNFDQDKDNKHDRTKSDSKLLEAWDGSDPFDVPLVLNISARRGRLEMCVNFDEQTVPVQFVAGFLSRFAHILTTFLEGEALHTWCSSNRSSRRGSSAELATMTQEQGHVGHRPPTARTSSKPSWPVSSPSTGCECATMSASVSGPWNSGSASSSTSFRSSSPRMWSQSSNSSSSLVTSRCTSSALNNSLYEPAIVYNDNGSHGYGRYCLYTNDCKDTPLRGRASAGGVGTGITARARSVGKDGGVAGVLALLNILERRDVDALLEFGAACLERRIFIEPHTLFRQILLDSQLESILHQPITKLADIALPVALGRDTRIQIKEQSAKP